MWQNHWILCMIFGTFSSVTKFMGWKNHRDIKTISRNDVRMPSTSVYVLENTHFLYFSSSDSRLQSYHRHCFITILAKWLHFLLLKFIKFCTAIFGNLNSLFFFFNIKKKKRRFLGLVIQGFLGFSLLAIFFIPLCKQKRKYFAEC